MLSNGAWNNIDDIKGMYKEELVENPRAIKS